MDNDSVLSELDKKMEAITGKKGVMKIIEEENDWRIERTLKRFNITSKNPNSQDIYDALLGHLVVSDKRLNIFLKGKESENFTNFPELLRKGKDLMDIPKLWVLKKEKFREILEEYPPPNILKKFGYKNGKELFDNEKLEEVASSLRFMESSEWMHDTFDKAYRALTPDDFEEREVEAIVLSSKWHEAAKEFVEKKRHNLSHLKELGLIFVIPITLDYPGELMRVFALYLHYLYEVQFYSNLFKGIADHPNFSDELISLLRGDVLDTPPSTSKDGTCDWLIVQRYLAKKDEWDKRLFIPHINPEAIHWGKAEDALARLDKEDLSLTFRFWKDLDWVGGYFKKDGKEELISFDLIDAVMSLVKEKDELIYLYHQQEALWTHLFTEYVGDGDKLDSLIKENLLKGYITIS